MDALGGSGRGAIGAGLRWWLAGLMLAAGWTPCGADPGQALLARHAVVLNGPLVGSAFALDEGLAVTNRHVVEGRRPGDLVVLVGPGPDAPQLAARIVAVSGRMDLALLAMPAGSLPVAALAEAAATAGEPVLAAGIDASGDAESGQRRAAGGVVLDPELDLPAFGPGLVVRLPGARPGFSGGPLVDGDGRLVGMVTAIRSATGAAALPSAGGASDPEAATVEAFALRASAVRAEVRRLLRGSGG